MPLDCLKQNEVISELNSELKVLQYILSIGVLAPSLSKSSWGKSQYNQQKKKNVFGLGC